MRECYGLLPDQVEWRDKGCALHPACLECPLPRCIEEEPRGKQKRRLQTRAEHMAEMKHRGIETGEIALAFGVSLRTVQRALQKHNGNGHKRGENSKP